MKLKIMVLFLLFLIPIADALKIEPQVPSFIIHPGEFQNFKVNIISEEKEENDVVLFINNPEDVICFFDNFNVVDVIRLKPFEIRDVKINTYANINIKSQDTACLLNYIIGLDDEKLSVIKKISEKSEIVIDNYTVPIGRIQPIYVAVRGNTTVPEYYIPSIIKESAVRYETLLSIFILSWVSFVIAGSVGIIYIIKLRKRKKN